MENIKIITPRKSESSGEHTTVISYYTLIVSEAIKLKDPSNIRNVKKYGILFNLI